MKHYAEIAIHTFVAPYHEGETVRVEVHEGTLIPKDSFWRRRLADAEHDDSVSIAPFQPPAEVTEPEPEHDEFVDGADSEE